MEKKVDQIIKELQKVCTKHGCDLGVWLTWRDLIANFEEMKKNPDFNEAFFGLQIRFKDGKG